MELKITHHNIQKMKSVAINYSLNTIDVSPDELIYMMSDDFRRSDIVISMVSDGKLN